MQTLKIAIGRLERATVDLGQVAAVQAARSDLEKVLTALNGQSTVYVENMTTLLRSVASALESIDDPEVRGAGFDALEASVMLEDSIRDWQG
jgi:hypothetical protein